MESITNNTIELTQQSKEYLVRWKKEDSKREYLITFQEGKEKEDDPGGAGKSMKPECAITSKKWTEE